MPLLDRFFKSGKDEKPTGTRVEQVVTAEKDSPRPVRGMSYREAYVIYESGYRRKGVVLDYSNSGVRVRFPTNERLPTEVLLNAKAVGIQGQARVVWQEGSEAGLTLT